MLKFGSIVKCMENTSSEEKGGILQSVKEHSSDGNTISSAIGTLDDPTDIEKFHKEYSALEVSENDLLVFAKNHGSLLTREKFALLDIALELKNASKETKEKWKEALPDLYLPEEP